MSYFRKLSIQMQIYFTDLFKSTLSSLSLIYSYTGEDNMTFLYVQNIFQWTPVDYSYFRTAQSITTLLGNVLGLWILVKILKINDLIILFITVYTRLFAQVIFGLAATSMVFYAGILLVVVTRLNRIAKRSYITKIVSENDIGKTISMLGIVEAIAPVVAVPVYNLIYQHTLESFPAMIFFFSVLIYTICSFIIAFMYWNDRRIQKKEDNLDKAGQNISTIVESTHI